MKRFLLIPFLLALLISSGCAQPQTLVPTETPSPVPQPTETPLPSTSTPEPTPTSTAIPTVTLQRGVNMGNMLEAPDEGEWGLSVQEEYFDLIKEAGFDFIRLPVRWSTHVGPESSYTIDP